MNRNQTPTIDYTKEICAIFSEVLEIKKNSINVNDSFYYLGGDSVSFIRLAKTIETQLHVTIDVRLLYKRSTPKSLSKLIIFLKNHPVFQKKTTCATSNKKSYNLSIEQNQILLGCLSEKKPSTYNIPWIIEITGKLDEKKLLHTLKNITENNPIFNSSIKITKNISNLEVHSHVYFNCEKLYVADCDAESTANKIANTPFRLDKAPLYRIRLLKTDKRHILCIIFHHLIIDSISLYQLKLLIEGSYNENQTIKYSSNYLDYLSYQASNKFAAPNKKAKELFSLPTETTDYLNLYKVNAHAEKNNNCSKRFFLDTNLLGDIKELCSKNNTTIFNFMLSIFGFCVSKLISSSDFHIGIPISTRTNSMFADTLGLFVNLIPFHFKANNNKHFMQLLNDTKMDLIKLYSLNTASITQALSSTSMNHGELFNKYRIAFTVDQDALPELEKLKTRLIQSSYIGHKFDLTLFVKLGKTPSILIEYNPEKFSTELIDSLHNIYITGIQKVIGNSNVPLNKLFLCQQSLEKVEINPNVSRKKSVIEQINAISKQHPNQIALKTKKDSLTYNDLDETSNQFANYLNSLGLKKGEKIAIYMPQSEKLIICIIGILKSGCAYVPIHPSTPDIRKKQIISQSKITALCIEQALPSKEKNKLLLIDVNKFFSNKTKFSKNYNVNIEKESCAYIIFTSGSTGTPKGVVISHENLNNLFSQATSYFSFENSDNWLLFHSYSFDFSVWEIFGALTTGGTLIIPDEQAVKTPQGLYQTIIEHNITVLNQTPTAFNIFFSEAVKHALEKELPLKYIIFGGEPINNQLILNWFEHYSSRKPKLVNMYGITEGCIHVTYQEINEQVIRENQYGTPIGLPLLNNNLAILDKNLLKLPSSFIGEIFITGESIAKSYINEKRLTDERFLVIPHLDNRIFYKTGDLGVKNKNNSFSYIGRDDNQVKINGYRIETDDIQAALLNTSYVSEAAVFIKETDGLNKGLAALIVPSKEKANPLLKITKLKNQSKKHFTTLPNGLAISDINQAETLSIYEEIFTKDQYLLKDLELKKNSIIFDVGANVGLFSIYAFTVEPTARIFAFEPFKALCDCLLDNKEIYGIDLTINEIGLSNIKQSIDFTYFDKVTSMSTYNQNTDEQKDLLLTAIKSDNKYAVNQLAEEKLTPEIITCQVDTISNQIKNHSIAKIDLLKIDVEGAELDVLQGISEKDWRKIERVIIEVNNINNRLSAVKNMLTEHGYIVHSIKDERFSDSNLYIVSATRAQNQSKPENEAVFYKPITTDLQLISHVRQEIKERLPTYMLPSHYYIVNSIPRNISGKIDENKIKNLIAENKNIKQTSDDSKQKSVIWTEWEAGLAKETSSPDENFFESGGTSILAIQLADKLSNKLFQPVSVLDIFYYPTIKKLEDKFYSKSNDKITNKTENNNSNDIKVSIVGMEGIFPESANTSDLWNNLISEKNCLTTLSTERQFSDTLVPVSGCINNPYNFDAEYFKMSPSEAEFIDPQQRLLLEICNLCRLNVKQPSNERHNKIGVFASIDTSQYLTLIDQSNMDWQKKRRINQANSSEFAATRIAYKLGLTGPAITVNSACSSSLSACIQAIHSLRANECDAALVCASSLHLSEVLPGYFYEQDGIMSKNGKCNPFCNSANGTLPGSAVVAVMLKRESDAVRDGNKIFSSINSWSMNNDGNDKAGFAAPSLSGQINCLKKIYRNGEKSKEISYIEAHGTGTKIGDPIELEALNQSIPHTGDKQVCLGSIKANIGHAGAASGLCGLIKSAMILEKKEIPPQINFTKWSNLNKNSSDRKFRINTKLEKLKTKGVCYAGVSSFGIGGTNIHILLESSEHDLPEPKHHTLENTYKNRKKYFYPNSIGEHCDAPPIKIDKNQGTTKTNYSHLLLIKRFLSIIKDELAVDSIGLGDSFFNLGGDSLIALGIISKIKKDHGLTLGIDDFYNTKDFESLIILALKNNNKNKPACRTLQVSSKNKFLILIHSGGGSTYSYNFFRHLNLIDYNILAIENEVLNDFNSSLDSIEAMAKHYSSLIHSKLLGAEFVLCGWSFGGNVAYEMATVLSQQGLTPSEIIMFDSWAKYPEKYLDFNNFKNIWFNKLDISYFYEDDLWIHMLWHRLKMLIKHNPNENLIPIKLYKALTIDQEMIVRDDDFNGWKEITNNISVVNIEATHQNILEIMQNKNIFDSFLE